MRAVLVVGALLSVFALCTTQADDPPKAKPESAAVKKLKEDLKVLEEKLRDEDPKVRREAGETLGQLAEAVNSTAFRLNQHFEYENEETLVAQLKAVQQMGPSVTPYLGHRVVRCLNHKNPEVRYAAVQAAVTLREPTAVPGMIDLLKDPDVRIRRQAAAGLGFHGYPIRGLYGIQARTALPALIELVQNSKEDANVRENGVLAIGNMGPGAKSALSLLIELFKNKENDAFLRSLSIRSAGRVAPEDKALIAWLIELLEDKQDFGNRLHAAVAIHEIGAPAKDAVRALLAAVRAEDVKDAKLARNIKNHVMGALAAIGPDAREAVPQLVEVFKAKGQPVELRQTAANALGEIGPAAKAAVPVLREALQPPEDERVIEAAKRALVKIEQ